MKKNIKHTIVLSLMLAMAFSLIGCSPFISREDAEKELVAFMLDHIIQNPSKEHVNYIQTSGQPWIDPPESAQLIIYAPPYKKIDKTPWEQLQTDKPIEVWWYFDNNLIEATEKEIALQKYVERYEYNSHDWSSYEFGILSISNDNKTATVYSASSFCPECAGGSILTLEKSDSGEWIIIDSESLWLS
jgi:hypothetical protein